MRQNKRQSEFKSKFVSDFHYFLSSIWLRADDALFTDHQFMFYDLAFLSANKPFLEIGLRDLAVFPNHEEITNKELKDWEA